MTCKHHHMNTFSHFERNKTKHYQVISVLAIQAVAIPTNNYLQNDGNIYIYEDELQLVKLKENCLLLKPYFKLRKRFLSPRWESNPQPSDLQ